MLLNLWKLSWNEVGRRPSLNDLWTILVLVCTELHGLNKGTIVSDLNNVNISDTSH